MNRFRRTSASSSAWVLISILSQSMGPAAWAGKSSVCARHFESLFDSASPSIQKFRRTGLKGLDRQQVLEVEQHLLEKRLANYGGADELKSDVQSYFEVQCLKYGANCRELTVWWSQHSAEYTRNPRFLQIIGDEGMTLQGLADLASAQFYQQVGKTKGAAWRERFAWLLSPRALATVAWTVSLSVGAKVLGSIYNAATLGSMMKLWNAYTDAAVAPIEAHLKRQGTRDLGQFSVRIQEWLTRRSELHLALGDLNQKLDQAQQKLQSGQLDEAQAERLWADFQSYFYGKFMAFNQSLPSNLREGRAFIYATEFSEPLAIANFISGRYDAFREAKRRVAALEERVRSGLGTDRDRSELDDERKYVEVTRKQVAAGLAGFLIRKYMYRDDAFKAVVDKSKNPLVALDSVHQDLIEAMGIPFFLGEFVTQLRETFKQYEIIFKAADLDAYTELQEKQAAQ